MPWFVSAVFRDRAGRFLLWTVLLALFPSRALATPSVVFVLDEPDAVVGSLQSFDKLSGQLGELSVEVQVTHAPNQLSAEETAVVARSAARDAGSEAAFWFSSDVDGAIRIYALHTRTGRVYARVVQLSSSRALQREELSVVLRAMIPAILEGGEGLGESLLVVGEEKEARPASVLEPEEPTPAKEKAWPRAQPAVASPRATAGYTSTFLSSGGRWQSGASLGAIVDWTLLRAIFETGYGAPFRIRGEGADAIVTRVSMSARAGIGAHRGRLRWGVEAGPLVEAWRRKTEIHSPDLVATPARTIWQTMMVTSLRMEVDVAGRVGVYFLGETQWLVSPLSLYIEEEESSRVLSIRRFRPHFSLGLYFDASRR